MRAQVTKNEGVHKQYQTRLAKYKELSVIDQLYEWDQKISIQQELTAGTPGNNEGY